MATREAVYREIDSERDYQDNLWPGRGVGEPNHLTVGEFVLLLEEYILKARAEWTVESKPEVNTLDIVRKVAGIAVNCMEQNGAPMRGG